MGQENLGILFDQKKGKVDSSHSLLKRICDCLNLEASIIILCWRLLIFLWNMENEVYQFKNVDFISPLYPMEPKTKKE